LTIKKGLIIIRLTFARRIEKNAERKNKKYGFCSDVCCNDRRMRTDYVVDSGDFHGAVFDAYLLLGAVGAPVFGGFRGGLNVLMGVTGGFLCSYPLMALLIAWILKLARKAGKEPGLSIHVAAMALSLVFCYLFGAAWFVLAAHATVGKAFASCVIPFVVPDLLKAVLASAVAIAVKKRLKMA
jgi:hypothetical protein